MVTFLEVRGVSPEFRRQFDAEEGLRELREVNARLQLLICELLVKNQQLRSILQANE